MIYKQPIYNVYVKDVYEIIPAMTTVLWYVGHDLRSQKKVTSRLNINNHNVQFPFPLLNASSCNWHHPVNARQKFYTDNCSSIQQHKPIKNRRLVKVVT